VTWKRHKLWRTSTRASQWINEEVQKSTGTVEPALPEAFLQINTNVDPNISDLLLGNAEVIDVINTLITICLCLVGRARSVEICHLTGELPNNKNKFRRGNYHSSCSNIIQSQNPKRVSSTTNTSNHLQRNENDSNIANKSLFSLI
jgi:hypothetical protein